jgi:magnesium chelatase family protein
MKVSYNGELDDSIVRDFTLMDKESINFMNQAYERMNLTMRAYVKVLKIARTIADIDGKEEVQMKHLAEALAYRTGWWQ